MPDHEPREPFYITTPLYYVNDELHIGHATTTIYADTLARFWRMQGRDVTFLTGSDEHGLKIFKAAKKAECSPREFADRIVGKFKELWDALGIEYTQFIRTTDPFHERVVQSFFARLRDRGFIYKGTYRALYCTDCEQAYAPTGLVDGKCPIHKTPPVELDEENYFFRLSVFGPAIYKRLGGDPTEIIAKLPPERQAEATKLLDGITPDESAIQPAGRRSEIMGKLREGLEDVSISRTAFDWGVTVPGDDKHVIWVWFDALINYVSKQMEASATAQMKSNPGILDFDALMQDPQFVKCWGVPAGKPHNCAHHLIGKDILWHHTCLWWSMLHAAGIAMPHRVYAHGWWNVEGDKMSKTLGNVIKPADFIESIAQKIVADATAKAKPGDTLPELKRCREAARDALRYYVLKYGPVSGDADFQAAQYRQVFNGELGGQFGNLLNRVLAMLDRYFGGQVPESKADPESSAVRAICQRASKETPFAAASFDHPRPSNDLYVWEAVQAANRLIDDAKPFNLAKDPAKRDELSAVMHELAQVLSFLAAALEPFMPDTAVGTKQQLGMNPAPSRRTLAQACSWLPPDEWDWADDNPQHKTRKGQPLFPRLEG
jgi:methionyl-tRNA synthetase